MLERLAVSAEYAVKCEQNAIATAAAVWISVVILCSKCPQSEARYGEAVRAIFMAAFFNLAGVGERGVVQEHRQVSVRAL